MIGIYCPTLDRPHSLARLVGNIEEATETPHRTVFVVEPNDAESLAAAEETGSRTVLNVFGPSYSNALQAAFVDDDSEFFVAANDDFDFQPGWDTQALAAMTDGISVVGLNDGSPGCRFTTIALVRRSYIIEQSGVIDVTDFPCRVFFPYQHNFVDTEFHATAAARGVFATAPDATILHKHPDWGHAERDETYAKGQASFGDDARTFDLRRHLWEDL